MNLIKIFTITIILIIIISLFIDIYVVKTHENIHKKIYNDYGCIASIKYSPTLYGFKGETNAVCSNENPDIKILNNLNEIVSYNFNILFFMIPIYTGIILLFLTLYLNKKIEIE